MTTLLQSDIDTADAAVTAKGQWTVAVLKERALHAFVTAVLIALKAYVTLKFGGGAVDTLADFGFAPKKKVVKTAGTRAKAAQKAVATRAARHTMGSVQKAAIKGTLAATPPVSPAPTPTTTPPAAVPPVPSPSKS